MEGNSFLSSHKTGSNGLHKLTAQTFKKRIQPNIQICSITLLENLTFPNANASQVPFIQRWEASFKIMSQFCEFRWVCFNNKYAQCEGNQNSQGRSPLRVDSPQIRMMMMMFLSGMCMSLCPKKPWYLVLWWVYWGALWGAQTRWW